MKDAQLRKSVLQGYEEGEGIFRLAPTWVPRSFLVPGGRIKLAPEDLYILGADRGGIDERWLASVTRADNPGAPEDEGLSYIVLNNKKNNALKRRNRSERKPYLRERNYGKIRRVENINQIF